MGEEFEMGKKRIHEFLTLAENYNNSNKILASAYSMNQGTFRRMDVADDLQKYILTLRDARKIKENILKKIDGISD